LLQDFGGWTENMKSKFAEKCGVTWLCDGENVEMRQEKDKLLEFLALPQAVRCWSGAPKWVRWLSRCPVE
jgi:hypothetical protein